MSIALGLAAGWRIVRGDAAAIRAIPATSQTARESFLAALVSLPFYGLMLLADPDPNAHGDSWLLHEAVLYPIGWMAFPTLAWSIALAQGRGTEFLRYLAAYNWVQFYVYALFAAVLTLRLIGVWEELIQMMSIGALIVTLAWSWFIARIGLDVGPWPATALVAIDLALSLMLSSLR